MIVDIASLKSTFGKSVATGLFAKGIGVLNQTLSIPLTALAVGNEGLSAVLLAISIASWFNLLPLGTQVALPVRLIAVGQDPARRRRIVAASTAIYGISAVLCLIGGLTLALPLRHFFRGSFPDPIVLSAATVMNGLYIFTWMSEHTLTADRRIHFFNIASALGSIVSLSATYCCYLLHLPTPAFVIAYYFSLIVPTVGMYIATVGRAGLTIADYQGLGSEVVQLIRLGSRTLGFQFSSTIKIHALLLVVAVASTSESTAIYGVGTRFCALFLSGVSILFSPLLAEAGHLIAKRQLNEYRRFCRRLILRGSLLAVATTSFVALLGPAAFDIWLGHVASINHTIAFSFGALASCLALEYVLFYAASPVAVGRLPRLVLWLEGPVTLAAGSAAIGSLGLAGMSFTAAAASAITSGVLITTLVRRPQLLTEGAELTSTTRDMLSGEY